MNSSIQKPDYGIDAPGVIRNNFIVAAGCFVLSFLLTRVGVPHIAFICPGVSFLVPALLMMLYSLRGKYKHRDRMLDLVNWRGDECVLDVGTGKGLLMIGAAKRLSTGRSYGIDIWNKEDLTGNNLDNALQNAKLEGVGAKVRIENENAVRMSYPDDSFDVVVSNLCLHNIYNKEDRKKACREIYRVLKPGGIAVISDFRHTREYQAVFAAQGMKMAKPVTRFMDTFPPLTIVQAVKQAFQEWA